jgi:hypothetical protein
MWKCIYFMHAHSVRAQAHTQKSSSPCNSQWSVECSTKFGENPSENVRTRTCMQYMHVHSVHTQVRMYKAYSPCRGMFPPNLERILPKLYESTHARMYVCTLAVRHVATGDWYSVVAIDLKLWKIATVAFKNTHQFPTVCLRWQCYGMYTATDGCPVLVSIDFRMY